MKSWQTACEQALRAFTNEDSLRLWGVAHTVDDMPRAPFDYRMEHTLAVVKLARWLAAETGADAEVVECAAWLHDCRKRLKDDRSKDTHAQDAAAAVPEILAGTDFPVAKMSAVQTAILQHVGLRLTRKLKLLESACLWDADKLSKIGAASLVHFGCISPAFQPTDTLGILKKGQAWLVLADGIAASMNTEAAQYEAQRRLLFLRHHYAQLHRECHDLAGDVTS